MAESRLGGEDLPTLSRGAIPQDYAEIPLAEMNEECRQEISLHLNPEQTVAANWRILGEHCGLRVLDLENVALKGNPTQEVIRRYIADNHRSATFHSFLTILITIRRADVVVMCKYLIAKDAQKYRDRPIQDPNIDSSPRGPITIYEQQTGDVDYYDAFVSYDYQDQPFVDTLIEELEERRGFRLCLPDRDLCIGNAAHNAVIAEMMEKRCKRVILVLSSDYMDSKQQMSSLEWELNFAQALAPGATKMNKLIPIAVQENLKPPAILLPYAVSDYTKRSQRTWFWGRVDASLAASTAGAGGYLGPADRLFDVYRHGRDGGGGGNDRGNNGGTSEPMETGESPYLVPNLTSRSLDYDARPRSGSQFFVEIDADVPFENTRQRSGSDPAAGSARQKKSIGNRLKQAFSRKNNSVE